MLAPSHLLLLALLILLALVVFGPKRLPELGASVGRAIQEFRKASQTAATELRSVADIGPQAPVVPAAPSQPVPAARPAADEVVAQATVVPDTPDPVGWSGDAPTP